MVIYKSLQNLFRKSMSYLPGGLGRFSGNVSNILAKNVLKASEMDLSHIKFLYCH